MKKWLFFLFCMSAIYLSACQQSQVSQCQYSTGTPRYLSTLPDPSTPNAPVSKKNIEIGNKSILVDKVIEGPLCNDTWEGIVYVTCNVQVMPWEDSPTFLKDCNLKIEPGTIVYVAYHNDSAYYNGCSCHTSDTATP